MGLGMKRQAAHEQHHQGVVVGFELFARSRFLRIGVKGGGCSGMSYLLAFDKKEAGDNEYEVEGIKMVMNKAHVMYVLGMEVDWENGLANRGFSFNNPNASSTCGCGQSFSA